MLALAAVGLGTLVAFAVAPSAIAVAGLALLDVADGGGDGDEDGPPGVGLDTHDPQVGEPLEDSPEHECSHDVLDIADDSEEAVEA